ncbi:hypothetical protein [Microbacterium sp.]|uniref:hypothetical protein n=1 Tax=Microbacterium sp. TaxID=51671 RepID=UPI00273394BD|nr:hypothetical protein [Microbacterium sp.]MDP3949623.1 hypothetical protein [Microbacterium sp.]
MSKTFSGSITWSSPILLHDDCLGQTIRGVVDSAAFSLAFPTPSASRTGVLPVLAAPPFHEPDWLLNDDYSERLWGWSIGDGMNFVVGGAMHIELASTEGDGAAYLRSTLRDQFGAWLEDVSAYVELWSGQVVSAAYAARTGRSDLQLFDHDDDTAPTVPADTGLVGIADGHGELRSVRLFEWESAATLVNERNPITLPWRLYHRAWRFGGRDPRAAVIDACTAVEVALSTRLTEGLYEPDDPAREEYIKRLNGLLGLVEEAYAKYPRPPKPRPDVAVDLGVVRNRAAHGGAVPTPDERDRALAAARWVLDNFLPLARATASDSGRLDE